MKHAKTIGVALASIAATTVFILSCGQGPAPAAAQTCTQWEFTYLDPLNTSSCATYPSYPTTCQIPAGWDIVGDSGGEMILRRCGH